MIIKCSFCNKSIENEGMLILADNLDESNLYGDEGIAVNYFCSYKCIKDWLIQFRGGEI